MKIILLCFLLPIVFEGRFNKLSAAELSVEELRNELKFGVEFTFKIRGLQDEARFSREEQEKVKENFVAFMKEQCANRLNDPCEVINRGPDPAHWGNLYDIKYSDGMYFRLSSDADVIETPASPHTYSEFVNFKPRFDNDLWNNMKKFNLEPHWYEGAGHIHIDYDKFFKNDRLLFRNFLVDFVNNYALGDGIFGENRDDQYGITVAYQGAEKVKGFRDAIEAFDANPNMSNLELAQLVRSLAYGYDKHGQALNLNRITGNTNRPGMTLEMRMFRPQASFDEFLAQIDLYVNRISYLSRFKNPIPIRPDFVAKLNPEQATDEFIRFVREMNLDPADYEITLRREHKALLPFRIKDLSTCKNNLTQLMNN